MNIVIVRNENNRVDVYRSTLATMKELIQSQNTLRPDDIRRAMNRELGADIITEDMMKQVHKDLVAAHRARKCNGESHK